MLQETIALLVTFMKRRQRLLIQAENVTKKRQSTAVYLYRIWFSRKTKIHGSEKSKLLFRVLLNVILANEPAFQ